MNKTDELKNKIDTEKAVEEKTDVAAETVTELSDKESEQANGGVFKSINGHCRKFVCKDCPSGGVYYRDEKPYYLGHYCKNGKWVDSSCDKCIYNAGGPFCKYHGFA